MKYEIDPSQGFYRDSVEALVTRPKNDPRRTAIEAMAQFDPSAPFQLSVSSEKKGAGCEFQIPDYLVPPTYDPESTPDERSQDLRDYFHLSFKWLLDQPLYNPEGYDFEGRLPYVYPQASLREIATNTKLHMKNKRWSEIYEEIGQLNNLVIRSLELISDRVDFTDKERVRIDDLGLPTRISRALGRESNQVIHKIIGRIDSGRGITPPPVTLGLLSAYTEQELADIRNLGEDSLNQIRKVIADHGLTFAY